MNLLSVDAKKCRYVPDEQTWQKSLNGKFWIGFYNDDKPTEKDLRRAKMLGGHHVTLTDGEKWLIPVARRFSEGIILPQIMTMGADGKMIFEISPEYTQLAEKVEACFHDFLVDNNELDEKPILDHQQRYLLTIEALVVNYHLGIDEVNLLTLLSTENAKETLYAVIDVPTIFKLSKHLVENAKKKTVEH